jgi:hypothetical protein
MTSDNQHVDIPANSIMVFFGRYLRISSNFFFWLITADWCVQSGIEGFDRNQLAHTDTVEKNCLPTMEVIQLEKSQ